MGQARYKSFYTAASDRYDRSRDRSIESIGSIDSIIFRSFKIFGNSSWRRCGSNGPKIMKIRAILAIFWPFEFFRPKNSPSVSPNAETMAGGPRGQAPPRSVRRRFDRFDNSFGSIDNCPAYLGGPLWYRDTHEYILFIIQSVPEAKLFNPTHISL